MNDFAITEWRAANHRYLMTALGVVRDDLERYVRRVREDGDDDPQRDAAAGSRPEEALDRLERAMIAPPALARIARMLSLTSFEWNLLLLAAGRDIDPAFDDLLAAAQGDAGAPYPTLRLAIELWPDGMREALAPYATLRRWGIIEVDPGPTTATRPFRLSERMLYHLDGVYVLDEILATMLEPVDRVPAVSAVHEELARSIADSLERSSEAGSSAMVQLCGGDHAITRTIAASVAAMLGVPAYLLGAEKIPGPIDQERLARLWELERLLAGSILFIDCQTADAPEVMRAARSFIDRVGERVIVAVHDPLRTRAGMVRIDVGKPGVEEQIDLWEHALGDAAPLLASAIEAVVGNFALGAHDIESIAAHVAARIASEPRLDGAACLWNACRAHARPRLEGLASRIDPRAAWDDLVLPETQRGTLRQLIAHVRQRLKVYHHWGVADRGSRGLGTSALFAGPSGTGKTLSAEVVAHELGLDLYHIDLSQVVSKYIGETEKNLRRIFDAAEEAGAVLLFDEADALFGKRSEVKDSHDRHANIEVSYLLQRMEAYRGLAILTTNMKGALDTAFMRRIRFAINFPFPDAPQRAAIWRRMYSDKVPTEGLDYDKLSRLNVAGGTIRNIALNAAFLAADEGVAVQMRHLLRASRSEYVKLEKPLTEIEIKEWVD